MIISQEFGSFKKERGVSPNREQSLEAVLMHLTRCLQDGVANLWYWDGRPASLNQYVIWDKIAHARLAQCCLKQYSITQEELGLFDRQIERLVVLGELRAAWDIVVGSPGEWHKFCQLLSDRQLWWALKGSDR